MALDPSIPLSVQQPKLQLPDPVEQYSKALTIKTLLGQQDLQGIQLQTAQQGLSDDAATRAAYTQSGGDLGTLRALLSKGGQYKEVQAIDKLLLDNAFKQSEIAKNTAQVPTYQQEALAKADKLYRDAFGTVANPQEAAQLITAGFNHPLLGPNLQMHGSLEDHLKRIPADPQEFDKWKQFMSPEYAKTQQAAATLAETARGHTLTARGQDLTAATALAGQNVTLRGQNLADARAAQTLEAGRWTNDLERGLQVNSATGETRPIMQAGEPLGTKGKPLTEAQGKAAGMLFRAQNANTIINAMEDAGVNNRGVLKQAAGAIPFVGGGLEAGINTLPQALGGPSPNQQKVEQARRSFVNAALRVESGAAISQSEFQNAEKQYFQQPGDSAAVRAQKRLDRDAELEALRLQAGPTQKAMEIRPALGATQQSGGKTGWSIKRLE